MTYAVRYGPAARRALTSDLPEGVAAAAYAFITGPLAANPYRVGTPLREPLAPSWSARRGEYRVVYDIDDDRLVITVVSIRHRRDVHHR